MAFPSAALCFLAVQSRYSSLKTSHMASTSSSSSSPTSVKSFDFEPTRKQETIQRMSAANNNDGDEQEALRRPIHYIRNSIFELSALVGSLSTLFLQHVPYDGRPEETVSSCLLEIAMAKVLSGIVVMAKLLCINVKSAVLKKMELNRRKYPAELCRGKAGKYTQYSEFTGITKDQGQSTLHLDDDNDAGVVDETPAASFHNLVADLPQLTQSIRDFATERKWSRYHQPRNLLLALMGEMGELAELFQWHDDAEQEISRELLDKAGQEIADVTIYLIRLADVCGVQLSSREVDEDAACVDSLYDRVRSK